MGELIFEALRRLDINQAQLAVLLGVSGAAISRWVSGRDRPDYESCLRLARAIGVPARRVLVLAGRDPDLLPDEQPLPHPWVVIPGRLMVIDSYVTGSPRRTPGQNRSA